MTVTLTIILYKFSLGPHKLWFTLMDSLHCSDDEIKAAVDIFLSHWVKTTHKLVNILGEKSDLRGNKTSMRPLGSDFWF